MAERTPTQSWGDLHLKVTPDAGNKTAHGQALFKITYAIDPEGGPPERTTPRPLVNDVEAGDCDPPIPPHSDFWPRKAWVDVAVLGTAYAPGGKPVRDMIAGLRAGGRRRLLRVFGERSLRVRRDGTAEIGEPQPFTEQPLGLERAYGGVDLRVPVDPLDPDKMQLYAMGGSAPGLFPRNPWGRGYLCVNEAIDGLAMPTQEDATDLLTPDRIVADPALWYRQPVPGHLGWLPVNCFPRSVFFSVHCDPWHPPPEDRTLPEVRMGLLPEGYRGLLAEHSFGGGPHWRFMQEAAPDCAFAREDLAAGPISVVGMHPEHTRIETRLPPPPEVRLAFDTLRETVTPSLLAVEILPGALSMSLTYRASISAPRLFMPGLHPKIPFGVVIDGEKPVWYEAPKTVKQILSDAQPSEETRR